MLYFYICYLILFLGNSTDVVTMCFSCKLAFKNWSQHFDPWTEHALYSPHCKYVLEIRGEQFINDVLVCLGYEPNPEIVVIVLFISCTNIIFLTFKLIIVQITINCYVSHYQQKYCT